MANYNRCIFIGRLTRDPVFRKGETGGGAVLFTLATEGDRKRNTRTGDWEGQPLFLDCKAFVTVGVGGLERGWGVLVRDQCRRGDEIHLEGRLIQERWKGEDAQERSAFFLLVDHLQLLSGKVKETPSVRPASPGETPTPRPKDYVAPAPPSREVVRGAEDAYPDEPGFFRRPSPPVAPSTAPPVAADDLPFGWLGPLVTIGMTTLSLMS